MCWDGGSRGEKIHVFIINVLSGEKSQGKIVEEKEKNLPAAPFRLTC